ncbi:MAG TPA: nitronate monooxygenase [Dehalococcoidia bacterium]|nr:nitronate monooxygenase [Dehalococcoidia bacterium]
MFKTRVTGLLGIQYPIVQGGMMWISRAELAGAVSNAGALGIITALTFNTPEELTEEIKKMRQLTQKPFGVNITWLPTLRPVNYDEYVDAVIAAGVKIVETAGRNPEKYLPLFKQHGIKVIHKCTTVRHALKAQELGCDIISIDGFECAGHPGEEDVTSLILTPAAAQALEVPIISSGGFADARGFVAALALGAEGINMGTRFMLTRESPIHPELKQKLIGKKENETLLLLRSFRNTERLLRTAVSEKALAMEKDGASIEQLAPLISGEKGRELLETGDLDRGTIFLGQAIGLIHDVPTVKEMVDDIIKGAVEIISGRLKGYLNA